MKLKVKNSFKLNIPGTPISFNVQERMHWSKWHKVKKQWIQDIFFLLKENGHSMSMGLNHIWVKSIVMTFTQMRYRDESNYEPTIIKPLLDALVYAKIIKDDTDEYVTRPGAVDIKIGKKAGTEITLEWE